MLFFPAASEKCKMWWVSVPRAQLIVNDVHQLRMWHVGPPFLLLPPPVSYSKWMKRTSKKLCLLSCRYVIKHFIFYNIRNIIEMKTLKDCLHWAWTSEVITGVKGGLLKMLSPAKSMQLMMRVYFSSLWATPKTHTIFSLPVSSWNSEFFGQKTFCLNATKCLGSYQKVWRTTQKYKKVKTCCTISAPSEYPQL